MYQIKRLLSGFVLVVLVFCMGVLLPRAAAASDIERVSIDSDGNQSDAASGGFGFTTRPSPSAEGRWVGFESNASNLVSGDNNGRADAFVHDRVTHTTERVSVQNDGSEMLNGHQPSLSADGCLVAFDGVPGYIAPNDANDVWVRDRCHGTTELVSTGPNGERGNGYSPSISADGRYVAFVSTAASLGSSGRYDLFVKDRQTGALYSLVANDPNGRDTVYNAPVISGDGTYVGFSSYASNLVSGDTNPGHDIFVWNRVTGRVERVNVAPDGSESTCGCSYNPQIGISHDGLYVAFNERAGNFGQTGGYEQVFVRDRVLGVTEMITSSTVAENSWSLYVALSGDGRFVVFNNCGTNLVPDDTTTFCSDVIVHDRLLEVTARVTHSTTGGEADGSAASTSLPGISPDGSVIAFDSLSTNLVPNDTNGWRDVFAAPNPLSDTEPPAITLVTPADGGVFLLGQTVLADYTCDDPSGVASCEGPVASGAAIDTASVGAKAFTVNAEDSRGNAGSLTHEYSVVYAFTGFFSPVDNLPTVNQMKAGRAVAVKFSLAGYHGLAIFAAGHPASQQISCDTSLPIDAVEETLSAGSSSLSYDVASDRYVYVWKTVSSWAGTCRRLIVRLVDGTEHDAEFKFTR